MAGTLNRITSLTFQVWNILYFASLSLIYCTSHQSMAPPTVCALVNLICSLVDNDTITVWLALVVGTNMVLPKLYAISAMWTLNSRKDFRTLLSGDVHSNIDISEGNFPKTTNSDLGELSQIRAPSPRRTGSGEQMELHSLDKVFPYKAPLPDNNTV
jgi:hypothetical protein